MTLKAADLFCGAGGTSCGAESTGAARVAFALNHWSTAVETHSRNFPHAKHVNSRLDQTSPGECGKIDLLFASPECTHHSRARGGRPTSDQQRSGAWDVMKWIEHHRPSWVVVENVVEFEQWGPVDARGIPLKSRRGAFFHAWIAAIEAAGYVVDWRHLNAADFGAATSRNRLFVVARKGRRAPVFPEPTRRKGTGRTLPGMGLPSWRTAAEVIDWSLPCPSIFSRKRPLADKTIARIEAGLRRFVGPFVASWTNTESSSNYEYSPDRPLPTVLTKAHMGLAVPYTVEVNHGGNDSRTATLDAPIGTASCKNGRGLALPYIVPNFGERDGQTPRTHGVDVPAPAITGHGAGQLAVPYMVRSAHGDNGGDRIHELKAALPTVTTSKDFALAVPFLTHFYGNSGASPISDPVDTITTVDRHSLAVASLVKTMHELHVVDVGFRMLQNHELAAAQGFPGEYVFCGSKADITRQIGNSVSPPVAAAITRAIAGVA
jgi:DNA (cytosine-5)-methyltransferase 1